MENYLGAQNNSPLLQKQGEITGQVKTPGHPPTRRHPQLGPTPPRELPGPAHRLSERLRVLRPPVSDPAKLLDRELSRPLWPRLEKAHAGFGPARLNLLVTGDSRWVGLEAGEAEEGEEEEAHHGPRGP